MDYFFFVFSDSAVSFLICSSSFWRSASPATRKDYAAAVQELLEVHYPKAIKVRLVQDNLNTHVGASLYEAFAPELARRLLDRIEFHYTPKHQVFISLDAQRDERGGRRRQSAAPLLFLRASVRHAEVGLGPSGEVTDARKAAPIGTTFS